MNYWKSIPASHFLPRLLSISTFMAQWGHKFFHKFRDKLKAQKAIVDDLVNKVDGEAVSRYFIEKKGSTNFYIKKKFTGNNVRKFSSLLKETLTLSFSMHMLQKGKE